jgi:hypothetical protein
VGASKHARGGGRRVVVGSGSDLSEVPVSGCKPAALDSESPLVVLPGPLVSEA